VVVVLEVLEVLEVVVVVLAWAPTVNTALATSVRAAMRGTRRRIGRT
jgi:hypothetical protein